MTSPDRQVREYSFPSESVDLTLAERVLGELAKRDGDLGAAYWQSVLNLLCCAGQMHTELLAAAARGGVEESPIDLADWI